MQLLNPEFIVLLLKVTLCVMPGVFGIYCIAASEEPKRKLRAWFCGKLFGVNNAIPYNKFARSLVTLGVIMLLFSLVASWFLLLRGFL